MLFAYHEMGYACMEALLEVGAPIAALFTHRGLSGPSVDIRWLRSSHPDWYGRADALWRPVWALLVIAGALASFALCPLVPASAGDQRE